MRLLVLTQDVGVSAPGIVFERILSELTLQCDVDIIACAYQPSCALHPRHVQIIKYPRIHYRIKNLLMSIFHTDLVSCFLVSKIRLVTKEYDAVVSFCSSGYFFGAIAGHYIQKRLNRFWACYCVDAVPAPLGWSSNDAFYRSSIRFARRFFSQVDLFASVNKEMLEYEVSLLEENSSRSQLVLYPPTQMDHMITLFVPSGPFCFLYTGNIYGLRTGRYLVRAFEQLCGTENNVELVFVGSIGNEVEDLVAKCSPLVKEKIHIFPRMKDLAPFYNRSSVLIDIDADIDNDVFLSSKMSSYITYNRPIICETGNNSPSRRLFAGIPSIIQCHHDVKELQESMLYCMRHFDSFDYSDRTEIIKQMNKKTVAELLHSSILQHVCSIR